MPTFLNPGATPGEDSTYGLSSGAVAGDHAFAAGMAIDMQTLGRLPEADTIGNETRVCLQHVEETLREGGFSLREVVKLTCYLSDDSYRAECYEAIRDVFAPGPYPTRVTLVVGIAGECRVEIEAIAARA